MKLVGKVTRYFNKLGVAVIELESGIKLGDTIVFKKGDNEVEQLVESIQIDNEALEKANKGDAIGMEVHEEIKPGSEVFLK